MPKKKAKYDAFDNRMEGYLLYCIMKGQATVQQLKACGIGKNITDHVKPFLDEGLIREAKTGGEREQLRHAGLIPEEAVYNGKFKVYVPNFDALAQKCAEYNLINYIFSPTWDLTKRINEDRKKGVDLITATFKQFDFEKVLNKIKSPEDAISALNNLPGIMKKAAENNPELSSAFSTFNTKQTESVLKKGGMPPEQIKIWKKIGGKFDNQSNVPAEIMAIIKAYLRISFELFEPPPFPETDGELTNKINDFANNIKFTPKTKKQLQEQKPSFDFRQTEENFIVKVGEARLMLNKEKAIQAFNKKWFPTLNEVFKGFPNFFLIYYKILKEKGNLSPQAAAGIEKLKSAFYEKYEDREEAFLKALKNGG